jgi:hypothetical protein
MKKDRPQEPKGFRFGHVRSKDGPPTFTDVKRPPNQEKKEEKKK